MKCYCRGCFSFFYLVLTCEKRNKRARRRVIAEGSRVAAAGVVGGSRGRAALLVELLGILPGLDSGRPCRACWACCTGRKRKDCSP